MLMPTRILISCVEESSCRSLKYPEERKKPTTAWKMSKLAMAEAMPWNLSISVDSILLKNLVLMMYLVQALRLSETSQKESVNFCLDGGSGLPISPLNKKAHGYTVSISAFSQW